MSSATDGRLRTPARRGDRALREGGLDVVREIPCDRSASHLSMPVATSCTVYWDGAVSRVGHSGNAVDEIR
jgi:hypothetical protein